MHWEVELARVASRQHSLVTWNQALAVGLDRRTLCRWIENGRLLTQHDGVFALPGAAATTEQAMWAAWLACGPDAVFSHRRAGAEWEIDRSGTSLLEMTVPRQRRPAPAGVILHRLADMRPDHLRWRNGLPFTSPARTLVDLGAVLRPRQVEKALERALVERLVTCGGVRLVLDDVARKGRAGAGVIRSILDGRPLGEAIPDGMLEPVMAKLLRDYGLPPAVFQHPVKHEGRRMKIDFAYPELKIAIEVDGYVTHRTIDELQDDDERQNLLVDLGWIVLRFTWRHVHNEPDYVAERIRRHVLGTSR
jgi:hypothetical protein